MVFFFNVLLKVGFKITVRMSIFFIVELNLTIDYQIKAESISLHCVLYKYTIEFSILFKVRYKELAKSKHVDFINKIIPHVHITAFPNCWTMCKDIFHIV